MEWLRVHDSELYLSAITAGELRKAWNCILMKKAALSAWLDGLLKDFAGYVLPFTEAESLTWGTLYGKAQKLGRKPTALDSLNAAIALHHGLTLVTRNDADYRGTGVKTLNPWNSLE